MEFIFIFICAIMCSILIMAFAIMINLWIYYLILDTERSKKDERKKD